MRRTLVLFAFALNSAPALAVPITIDVTGTVSRFLTFEGPLEGTDRTGELADLSVHGSVTFDRSLAPPPETVGGVVPSYRQMSTGAPPVEFVSATMTWANGTFVPTPLVAPPGAFETGDTFLLQNLRLVDQLSLTDQYSWSTPTARDLSRISFTFDDDFIAGDGIPTGDEFPDLGSAAGAAFIQSVRFDEENGWRGFRVDIDLTSATVRAVPEPATLGLLAAGLLAIAFVRRRSRAS